MRVRPGGQVYSSCSWRGQVNGHGRGLVKSGKSRAEYNNGRRKGVLKGLAPLGLLRLRLRTSLPSTKLVDECY